MPSCILAPPEEGIINKAQFFSIAVSTALIIALPTDLPIEPPINEKSNKSKTQGFLLIRPYLIEIASYDFDLFLAILSLSEYFFKSLKSKGSSFIVFILIFSIQFSYSQKVNWVSFEQAVELQKTNPKNIMMDVYTEWCGPCKNIP